MTGSNEREADDHACSYSHLLQSLEVEGLADKVTIPLFPWLPDLYIDFKLT